jgi:hypothetical protein
VVATNFHSLLQILCAIPIKIDNPYNDQIVDFWVAPRPTQYDPANGGSMFLWNVAIKTAVKTSQHVLYRSVFLGYNVMNPTEQFFPPVGSFHTEPLENSLTDVVFPFLWRMKESHSWRSLFIVYTRESVTCGLQNCMCYVRVAFIFLGCCLQFLYAL